MLVSAKFENVFSFKDETKILFTAGKSDKLPLHVSRAEKRDDLSVLRMGLIYGANASGKSNLVKCLAIIRDFALRGWTDSMYEPFKLVLNPSERSNIEVEFKTGDSYYAYGVAFCKAGLLEEWLYKTGSRTDTMIYERQRVDGEWKNTLTPTLKKTEHEQFLQFLLDGTPSKGTFLNEYMRRNGKGIDDINRAHSWFRNLNIIFPSTRKGDFPVRVVEDEPFKKVLCQLLDYFGTGISDLQKVKIRPEDVDLPDVIRKDIDESLPLQEKKKGVLTFNGNRFIYVEMDENLNKQWYELKTIHRIDLEKNDGDNENTISVPFNIREESDGTARLLDFLPMLIDMRSNNAVYVIDEVDRSLHPNLTLKLLELYDALLSDANSMQLVCTTHESNLLSAAPIRQDEVWFVEKDRIGASHLASLSEFKPRENIQKGYLNGRYGAIPFFGELSNIHWDYEK